MATQRDGGATQDVSGDTDGAKRAHGQKRPANGMKLGDTPGGGPPPPAKFKMCGVDHVTTATDTWVVTGTPDYAGAHYAGGLATPLRFVTVSG